MVLVRRHHRPGKKKISWLIIPGGPVVVFSGRKDSRRLPRAETGQDARGCREIGAWRASEGVGGIVLRDSQITDRRSLLCIFLSFFAIPKPRDLRIGATMAKRGVKPKIPATIPLKQAWSAAAPSQRVCAAGIRAGYGVAQAAWCPRPGGRRVGRQTGGVGRGRQIGL